MQRGIRVVVQAVVDSKYAIVNWGLEGLADSDLAQVVDAKAAGEALKDLSALCE